MPKATFQDASILLQIAQWSAAMDEPAATNWVWSDQFIPDYAEFLAKCPRGSEGFGNAEKVCVFFETLGTLWKHGLLNADLIFDWVAVSMVWERVKSIPLGLRQESGNPRLYENFEALANANVAYDARLTKRAARAKKAK